MKTSSIGCQDTYRKADREMYNEAGSKAAKQKGQDVYRQTDVSAGSQKQRQVAEIQTRSWTHRQTES
jgi:hypothetical protein